jgi:hypothetical protein
VSNPLTASVIAPDDFTRNRLRVAEWIFQEIADPLADRRDVRARLRTRETLRAARRATPPEHAQKVHHRHFDRSLRSGVAISANWNVCADTRTKRISDGEKLNGAALVPAHAMAVIAICLARINLSAAILPASY